ncbi:prepilin-type N-terminal cleavage/methylation domain-containing protein [Bradyrhizobium sp. Pear77]|uniref:PulJ/GspJ family protein n=1 Tax=Bradyrhizobium altum TaxID=1571202 RepID=UPI001E31AEBA|nr:prepilin-type N-terminal cleavage/methylation domain-containing protein [Bradyrhizobium altum]MCC8954297.1 prepilin-type N-terminal cleavage/methylation domain-containing protein [Bradyrhizobium altum]
MSVALRRGLRAASGFTLIEVLAALAIGSAVIAATAVLINNVALNFDRRTGLAGKTDQLLLAVDRLAADIGAARQVKQGDGADATAAFNGDANQMTFVTGSSAGGGRGEEVVSLQVEETDGVNHLVRRRARWQGQRTPFASVALQDPVGVIEGQVDIAFAFGSSGPDGTLSWSTTWIGQPLLPRLVRLTVRDRASGADLLPGVQFTLRADAPIGCAQPGANADCVTGKSASPKEMPAKDPPPGARR